MHGDPSEPPDDGARPIRFREVAILVGAGAGFVVLVAVIVWFLTA
jgi:hypothetical protein